MSRIQVILSDDEIIRLKQRAKRDGQSLSAWMREAGLERLHRTEDNAQLTSAANLEAFFAECDQRPDKEEEEPDWDDHRETLNESRRAGLPGT